MTKEGCYELEFKHLGEGAYFPPILPDGDFIGVPAGRNDRHVLFSVTQLGLMGQGVNYLWSDLSGVVLDGGICRIASSKYPAGGFAFHLANCSLRHPLSGELIQAVQGYSVEYCLMNRVTFEVQKLRRGQST